MLRERLLGDKSFFADYVDNLPMGVPGIPIFFAPEAVKALEQYPPLRQDLPLHTSSEHFIKEIDVIALTVRIIWLTHEHLTTDACLQEGRAFTVHPGRLLPRKGGQKHAQRGEGPDVRVHHAVSR